jgi:K+-sensing histidine kinase KdpD
MRHELYGSLNSIIMTAGLLAERARKREVPPEEIERLSGRIVKQVERATAIVDHYVEMVGPREADEDAAADDGRAASVEELRAALESARARLSRRGARLEVSLGELSGEVRLGLDPGLLRYALGTLTCFAAERAPAGAPISVFVNADEDEMILEVGFEGGTLTVDDLHVFERGPRGVDALLIDLAVARRILTDAGGELSPRERGFVMRVPVVGS